MRLGMRKLQISDTLLVLIGISSLLGQFARFETFLGTVSVYEVLMIIFTTFTIWKNFSTSIFRNKIFLFASLFLTWSIGITLIQSWPEISSSLSGIAYLLRLGVYGVFAWSLVLWRNSKMHTSNRMHQGITLWFALMGVLGIGQYLLLPDTRILAELGWDDHLSRAFGTLFDPTFYGCITALGSIWFFYHGLLEKKKLTVYFWQGGFALLLLTTTLSFSRASYIAYVAGFLILAWFLRHRRVLLAIPLLVMALFLVPKDGGGEGQKLLRTRSIEQRLDHAEYQTQNWTTTEIIFGRGWNFQESQERRSEGFSKEYQIQTVPETIKQSNAQLADSLYLQILLGSGAVGLGLFLLTLLSWWSSQEIIGKASIFAVAVHSLASPGFFYPWILLILIVISSTSRKRVTSEE